jgi:hypothetical protein
MWDYLFMDNDSGEQFFVECDTEDEAWEIIDENFDNIGMIDLCDRYTPAEAEWMGFDTL